MLNSTKVIVKKNSQIIGNIKDIIIKISNENLIVIADIVYNDDTREICAIEKISSDAFSNCIIDIKELEYQVPIPESEKVIDIRDFHNPYRTK